MIWLIMQVIAFILLVVIVSSCSNIKKRLDNLDKKVRKMNLDQKRGTTMSKLITNSIGKECYITDVDAFENGNVYTILDADDEWVKLSHRDIYKRNIIKTEIMRIDSIEKIEFISTEAETEENSESIK